MNRTFSRRTLLASLPALALFPYAPGESATGEPTMDQRISLITLGVRDLAASKKFYVEGLGWKPAFENKEIIFFQAGGLIFALYLRDELAKDFNADPATLGRSAIALAYNVRTKAEVDPLIQRAAAAGAAILKQPVQASWGGYSGYFADPDGFAWEVAFNPQWPIAPDGTIRYS